ncbi:cupin domain-containing protein [Roseomonas rosulenta]|uniref:cupin domain-containing protein n=1 Tax=Roseomonas rosulenta TaxID=2748667 RepID=UPI0018DF1F6B|nr:cupin domain-containing protein [Roseomonas rosulenta]
MAASRPGASSTIPGDGYAWTASPILGVTGGLAAALLKADPALRPVVAALRLGPGARMAAHRQHQTTESLLVLEGEFINAGEASGPGAFLAVRTVEGHGPHETRGGCTIPFTQAAHVDPTDFEIVE